MTEQTSKVESMKLSEHIRFLISTIDVNDENFDSVQKLLNYADKISTGESMITFGWPSDPWMKKNEADPVLK